MKKRLIFIGVAVVLTATIGCTGKMDGVIRRDARRIEIVYTDSRVAVAELVTVLPDGERFSGKPERLDIARQITTGDSAAVGDLSAHFEDLQSFSGNTQATLSGNRGNTIKCRFKLTDVIIGFSSGGFGVCQIADGRVIDVFF